MRPIYQFARAADVQNLLVMMREFYAHERLPFDEAILRAALDDLIGNEAFGRAWLIEVAEEPVGYAVLTLGYSLEFHGRDAIVDELFIREPYRGRGLGNRMLQVIEAHCRQLGIAALHLAVDHGNFRAQSVYRKFGFAGHDRYLMTKWLAQ